MTRALTLGVVALITLGCGDSSSSGGGGAGGDAGNTTATGAGDPGCGNLAESFMQLECSECAEDACCNELLACGSACEEGAQQEDLDACLQASCAEPCELISEGICGSDFTNGDAACDACLEGACCAPLNDCLADATCAGCLEDASDPACDGDVLLEEALGCFGDACSGSCDG